MRRAVLPILVLLAMPASAVATAGPGAPRATPRVLRLIPQVSIRGVSLGMTPAQVQAVLGRPSARQKGRQPGIGATLRLTFGLVSVRFDGVTASSEAVTITTTSHRERTSHGVGVGSSEAIVRERVPGAKCLEEYGYRHCIVGVQKAGQVVTDFSIGGSGRVTRISLARMLD